MATTKTSTDHYHSMTMTMTYDSVTYDSEDICDKIETVSCHISYKSDLVS